VNYEGCTLKFILTKDCKDPYCIVFYNSTDLVWHGLACMTLWHGEVAVVLLGVGPDGRPKRHVVPRVHGLLAARLQQQYRHARVFWQPRGQHAPLRASANCRKGKYIILYLRYIQHVPKSTLTTHKYMHANRTLCHHCLRKGKYKIDNNNI